MKEYWKQFVNKYVINFKKKIVNFNTLFFYTYLIFIYIILCIIITYIFYKYISDLRKRLVKSEVEGKEVKSYFVKSCRQARVELTRTTWPIMNTADSPTQVWALLLQLTSYPWDFDDFRKCRSPCWGLELYLPLTSFPARFWTIQSPSMSSLYLCSLNAHTISKPTTVCSAVFGKRNRLTTQLSSETHRLQFWLIFIDFADKWGYFQNNYLIRSEIRIHLYM